MNRKQPPPPKPGEKPKPSVPKWNSPLWYLPLMLMLVWFWQSTVIQFSYKTILYSEFKKYLRSGLVGECVVKDTTVEGTILPSSTFVEAPGGTNAQQVAAAATNTAPAASASNKVETAELPKVDKKFFFRTVRVEDPNLVGELEKAQAKFRGERPSMLSQFMMAWLLP